MPTLTIDPQKKFVFSDIIDFEYIDNKYIVISRDTANWLLLDNICQVDIFKFLMTHTVEQCFNNFGKNNQKDFVKVLTEISAKHFDDLQINYPQTNGMYLYLTNSCNQNCNHCYMNAGKKPDNELSTKEIASLLYNFNKMGGKVVTFTGGEATLRDDFFEIIKVAKEYGFTVCLLTNGLLCNTAFAKEIKKYVDEVQISLDGYDAESYQAVRNSNCFPIVLESIDNLVTEKIRTTIAITPLLNTLISNEERYCLFAKHLINKYKDEKFFVKFNTELLDGRNISPSEEENDLYRNAIKRIKAQISPESSSQGFALDHRCNTVFNNCGYGGVTIASNGDVYFCNLISKCKKQGNIREHDFPSIMLRSEQARIQSDINNLIPCNSCSLKYLCGGGCRIKNFSDLVNISFSNRKNILKINRSSPCTKEHKEGILRSMIAANKYMYR